jgi:hypothetical protein
MLLAPHPRPAAAQQARKLLMDLGNRIGSQFIRLAWSIDNGAPIETPQLVACRYSSPICGR